jgi:hypothetical protein
MGNTLAQTIALRHVEKGVPVTNEIEGLRCTWDFLDRLDRGFPGRSAALNRELAYTLIALANVPDAAERELLAGLSSRPHAPQQEYPLPKGPGRDYTVAEVLALADTPMEGRGRFGSGGTGSVNGAC